MPIGVGRMQDRPKYPHTCKHSMHVHSIPARASIVTDGYAMQGVVNLCAMSSHFDHQSFHE